MEFDFAYVITIFLIGFIGSYISGMVGIGGSIIKYPMLLYIPSLLGVATLPTFTAHEVSGISAVQVLFATIGGVWAYRKDGYINKKLIIYMGSSILIGSLIGGYGSKLMSEGGINVVYGILAVIAAIMMFIPKKGLDDIPMDQVKFNKWLAAGLSLIVGIGAGIVGAAGAFLLVPDYASCFEDSDKDDDCHIISHYVYVIHRFHSWQGFNGSGRLLAGLYYDYRQFNCLANGCKDRKKNKYKNTASHFSFINFSHRR